MLGDNGGTNNIHLTHETNGDFGVWNGTWGRGNSLMRISSNGTITVPGDIVLQNADCAEEFTIEDVGVIEPGTVMVLGEEGLLRQSTKAYDKKVAGVISGAGDLKPGLI